MIILYGKNKVFVGNLPKIKGKVLMPPFEFGGSVSELLRRGFSIASSSSSIEGFAINLCLLEFAISLFGVFTIPLARCLTTNQPSYSWYAIFFF